MLKLRGGGGDAVMSSMVPEDSLAIVCASWILANGFLLTLTPKMGIRLYGTPLSKDAIHIDPIMVYLSEVIGMTLLGQGVMFYLSTVAGMQVHRAIGFGLSVRFVYLLLSFATGRFEQFKIKRQFLSVYTGFMTWTIFQLLTGRGKPKLEARIFSCIALVRSFDIHVRPIAAAEKFFGLDVSTGAAKRSRIFMSVLGQSFLSSAVFIGALAWGVQPMTAAGLYCLAWCLLGIKLGFWDQSYKILGKNPWYQLITLGPSILFAIGFLVPW